MYQLPLQLHADFSWNKIVHEDALRDLLDRMEWCARILSNQAHTNPAVMAKLRHMCPNPSGKYPDFGEGIEPHAQTLLNWIVMMRGEVQG